MGISIFPSTAAEFVSNNFVVDMNDTTNNVATDIGGVKQAGPYSMSFASGTETTFDVYLINEDGDSVGYSNTSSITASGLFDTVVILGVASDEIISFLYQGSVNNADQTGTEPGAGAYLTSISPADLPSIDDTATVVGGNFGTSTEITFESGTISLPAKNITVTNGTSIIVTRPDGLIEDDAPYDLKAINTGVTPPTGTDSHILSGTVTAGSDPTWVTTSPLNAGSPGVAFSQTLEATDSDGTVVDYSVTVGTITPGLTLNSSTGVLSGTPTTGGNFTFTVTATDDGGNETDKQFEQAVQLATGGTISDDGGFRYHTFTSSDDLVVFSEITDAEYLIVAGGGGGATTIGGDEGGGGGGGAGGLLSGTATISAGTLPVVIGAGGAAASNGSNTTFNSLTAIGGGAGGEGDQSAGNDGSNGGSGGGGGSSAPTTGGTATAGQGNDGGDNPGGSNDSIIAAGGGGAGASGSDPIYGNESGPGGDGLQFSAFATATSTGADGGYYAGGGGGGTRNKTSGDGGLGGGGNGGVASSSTNAENGTANTGGGGGGGGVQNPSPTANAGSGGSGIVIVRYAF